MAHGTRIEMVGGFVKVSEGQYTAVLSDGWVVDVWKGWSRLGGEGWQFEPGGRCYPNRKEAVQAFIRKNRKQPRGGEDSPQGHGPPSR